MCTNLPLRSVLVLVALVTTSACSIVKSSRVRPDWEQVDRNRVKRLAIVTTPLPAGDPKVGEMWSAIAARHVDLKREFIVKSLVALPAVEGQEDLKTSLCVEGLDGLLLLKPDVTKVGEGVEAALNGHLFRCVDGEEVWAAEAAGSWPSKEEKLTQTIADYTEEFGPEVQPYVVASYHLLRDTLDTLPNPTLTEEEQGEKIEHTQ